MYIFNSIEIERQNTIKVKFLFLFMLIQEVSSKLDQVR